MITYDSLKAMQQPVFLRISKPPIPSDHYLNFKEPPYGVKLIIKKLLKGVTTKKELLKLKISKSSLEKSIAWMYHHQQLTKHPTNPNNYREGMSYKLCK